MELSYDIEHTLAILIGTGNYEKNDFIPIKPVKGNLEDLRNIFLDKDVFGLPEQRIIVLEDKTAKDIIKTLKEVLKDKNLKTVFLYYAGHGHRIAKDRLFLTAYDSESDFDMIKYSGIEFTNIKDIIENSPGKPNCIVIIDACYSGIATQSDSTLTEEERIINGTCIIASSSKKEQSFFDQNGKHTFFTDELIEILNNGSEKLDMLLSINDIFDHLQSHLRSKKLSEPQRCDNLDSKIFYFAKNKKYNKDFFWRKAEEHFKYGNYSKALEYYFILEDKFNEKAYSEQIEKCRKEIDYSKLIIKADSLFSNKKYEQALDKYNEAKEIKPDSSLLFKISRCTDYVLIWKEVLEEQHQRKSEEEKRKEQEEIRSKIEEERKQKKQEEFLLRKAEELKQKQKEHEEEIEFASASEAKSKLVKELERQLEEKGYRLKAKGNGWVVYEPLGGQVRFKTLDELEEYTRTREPLR